jgi:ATP-dependent DNA helicase DinG
MRKAISSATDVDAVLGPGGLLARAMSGYEHRAVQLQMARAVERTLAREELLLCEAGTGTGKTLAYLVPALLSGQKVVVSTGTKTLQDQIVLHDVPLLERCLGRTLDVAVMKGLNNYLCRRRYREYAASAAAVLPGTSSKLPLLEDWLARTETGDRSELELGDDAAIWSEVQSATDTRIGARCVHHDECFVTRMRARAEDAQLVIVNHHLFFADLALRGSHSGGAIPDYEAVIFDEAHLLEDVATEFFGVSVSTTRLSVLLRDAGRALAAAGLAARADRLIAQAQQSGAAFFAALPRAAGEGVARVPLTPETFADRLQAPMFALDNALDGLSAFCKRNADAGEPVAQIARRSDQIRDDVARIADGGGGGHVCSAQSRGRSASVSASPIEVGAILRDRLFYRGLGLVLTSATLSAEGSFAFLRSRLGIDFEPSELLLASPFDYPAQAALYLPEQLPDPREPTYLDAAQREIAELIALTDGGAFVLCTSNRVMRALGARLSEELGRLVLVQGEAPNAALLERFRSDGRAVLVATAGFWHGVDVPGDALRLVIIDKLPFDVPTDPLVAARCDRLKQQGEQPFMKYLVPSAALALKQGFGRLIRSRRDRGVVAILDSRVVRKGYGRALLRSLPPATRCRTLQDAARFWRGVPEDGSHVSA